MKFVDLFNHYRDVEDAKDKFLTLLNQYVHDNLDATRRQDIIITREGKFVQMFRYMPHTDTVKPAGGNMTPIIIPLEKFDAS